MLVAVQVLGIKQVEIDPLNLRVPPGIPRLPAAPVMRQQPISQAIAMVVEAHHSVGGIDMRTGKTALRNDPFGIEARQRAVAKVDTAKDVARAESKEDPVRFGPASIRVAFDSGFWPIH